MTTSDRQAEHPPEWACAYFREFRDTFEREMPHRRDAFERLSRARHVEMQRVWRRIDEAGLDEPWEIIGTLIYSTDTVIPNERIPRYGPVRNATQKRLTPKQTRARKLANLLRELAVVTPQRCEATRKMERLWTDIEGLCIAFDFSLPIFDLDACRRKRGIEFTADSKRGFIQCRRASDDIRENAIKVALQIDVSDRPAWLGDRLSGLIDDLRSWPSFDQEHRAETEYLSQKASWCDWVRVVRDRFIMEGVPLEMLSHEDWSTLVNVLFDVEVDRQSVERVINKR